MKTLLKISLVTLALSAPALAGPSDGGGTNIADQNNELTEFVKSHQEIGKKPLLIDARKFKMPKELMPVYSDTKGIIDRAENLYPGMGAMMEKAYDKPWLVVNIGDKDFPGRKAGERKVISQNNSAVYVSLNWLRKASPSQVREAFFHEGVRAFAHEYANLAFLHKLDDHPALDDEITEELTPVLYKKLPPSVLNASLEMAHDAVGNFGVNVMGWRSVGYIPRPASRELLYTDLKKINASSLVGELCVPAASDGIFQGWKMDSAREVVRKKIGQAGMQHEILKYKYDNSKRIWPLDESADELTNLIVSAFQYEPKTSDIVQMCKDKKFGKFLQTFASDQGKVQTNDTPATDRLPDDDEEKPASEHDAG